MRRAVGGRRVCVCGYDGGWAREKRAHVGSRIIIISIIANSTIIRPQHHGRASSLRARRTRHVFTFSRFHVFALAWEQGWACQGGWKGTA
jgi:hypothetical protein